MARQLPAGLLHPLRHISLCFLLLVSVGGSEAIKIQHPATSKSPCKGRRDLSFMPDARPPTGRASLRLRTPRTLAHTCARPRTPKPFVLCRRSRTYDARRFRIRCRLLASRMRSRMALVARRQCVFQGTTLTSTQLVQVTKAGPEL
jgi:hypothetical protein